MLFQGSQPGGRGPWERRALAQLKEMFSFPNGKRNPYSQVNMINSISKSIWKWGPGSKRLENFVLLYPIKLSCPISTRTSLRQLSTSCKQIGQVDKAACDGPLYFHPHGGIILHSQLFLLTSIPFLYLLIVIVTDRLPAFSNI